MIGDVVARMKRMRGFNVLHPFGWDAFGLPAENAAIKNGTHPETSTLENIAHMKGQLQRIGISYAWEREVATCLPDYYKWNQWLFVKMLERDLAYRRRSSVNWCPSCNTVLGKRASRQWWLLALRHAGHHARPGAVVLPHHTLCGRTAGCDGAHAGVAREGPHDAAQLDRQVRGGQGQVPAAGWRRGCDRGVHDADRHDLRRDLSAPRAGTSAGERMDGGRCVRRSGGARRPLPCPGSHRAHDRRD